MHDVRQFILPGAIIGSLILASFGYSVMARAPKVPPSGTDQKAVTTNQDEAQVTSTGSGEVPGKDDNQGEDNPQCQVSPNFPGKVRQWCGQIMRHAANHAVDPNLVAAIIWQESGGNPGAYSKSGAVGLMQVMPRDGIAANFQCINGPCFSSRPTIAELEKPNFNIKYGTGMIAGLIKKYGSLREALKFYGPMNVGYYYADKVLSIYQANSG